MSNAQYVHRSSSFTNIGTDTSIMVEVGGYLDAHNSVNTKLNYFFSLDRYYLPSFGPLNTITIRNNGKVPIDSIALVNNNKGNWYNLQRITDEILNDPANGGLQLNERQRALAIWKFVKENHIYFYPPEAWGSIEGEDPIRFLTSYGYGNCFMIANTAKLINNVASGDRLWIWGIDAGYHGVTECRIDNRYGVIDADRGAFYLKLDNEQLASFEDLLFDKYLFVRTKHFEPAYPYSSPVNYSMIAHFLANNNYRAAFTEQGTLNGSAFFSLKGGESISFSTATSSKFHHQVGDQPDTTTVQKIIGTGLLSYHPDLNKVPFQQVSTSYSNINIDSSSGVAVIRPVAPLQSFFIVKMNSSFVFTGGHVKMDRFSATAEDSIMIEYSTDLNNWSFVSSSAGSGRAVDSINIDALVNPAAAPGNYQFYLRFTFLPHSDIYATMIHDLTVNADFQVSKFFIPKLQLGSNTMRLTSAAQASKNLSLDVDWTEDYHNRPPARIMLPTFPQNNVWVDSTTFTFKWAAPADEDGDAIADYHFQMSDDSLMRVPLAPNFDRYISPIDASIPSQFKSEIDNFLIPGKRYYWRVRALDARGAWGEWSPTWTFIPHGAKSVVNPDYIILDSLHLKLQWSTSNPGNYIEKYLIHGSNEQGFYPTKVTLIDTVNEASYTIRPDSALYYKYYRVVAIDSMGNQSPPSEYITVPQPVRLEVDSVYSLEDSTGNKMTLSYSADNPAIAEVSGYDVTGKNAGNTYVYKSYINDLGLTVHQEKQAIYVTGTSTNLMTPIPFMTDSTNYATALLHDGGNLEKLSTPDPPNENKDLVIYPNPATTILMLKVPAGIQTPYVYYFTRLDGTQVLNGKGSDQVFPLDVSNYPTGTYVITLIDDRRERWSKKVIIAK